MKSTGQPETCVWKLLIDGLGAPLHQGAIRYYREIGLDIPPRLLLAEAEDGAGNQASEAL